MRAMDPSNAQIKKVTTETEPESEKTDRDPNDHIDYNSQESRTMLMDLQDDVAPLPPKAFSPERKSLKLVAMRSEEQKAAI